MKTQKRNQLRIIGGSLRARKISFPDSEGLRPTPDRVRETLFNWLSPAIVEARCLDLFAGSGALSLESISRGAKFVLALEKNANVFQAILEQAEKFKILNAESRISKSSSSSSSEPGHAVQEGFHIIHADSLTFLKEKAKIFKPFDIVFVDPPYGHHLLFPCFTLLNEGSWLTSGTLIYAGTDQAIKAQDLPKNWEIIREQKAGVVYFYLIRVKAQETLHSG